MENGRNLMYEKKDLHCEVRSNLKTFGTSVCIKIAFPKIGTGYRLKKPSGNDDSLRLITF